MYQINDKHFTSNLYKTELEAIYEWKEYLFNECCYEKTLIFK